MKLDQPDDFDDDLGVSLLNLEVPVEGMEQKDEQDGPVMANEQKSEDDQQSEIVQPSVSDVSDVRNQFDDGECCCLSEINTLTLINKSNFGCHFKLQL